jgi:sugar lactone lactonase YvrE
MTIGKKEKARACIEAAKKAEDRTTAILLLKKAKHLDPNAVEVYDRLASIYEEMGRELQSLNELRGLLEIDPFHWDARYRAISLEYSQYRNLKRASDCLRDLVWEKKLPRQYFNCWRTSGIRDEYELGYDEQLVGEMAYCDREGYGSLSPASLAFDAEHNLYLLERSSPWLIKFDGEGRFLFGNDLWITDEETTPAGPSGIVVGTEGRILFADAGNNCLRRYDPEGRYMGKVGSGRPRSRPGAMAEPRSVAVDRQKRLYVLNARKQGIHVYSPKGRFIKRFGDNTTMPGSGRNDYCSLATDPSDRIYLYDSVRIQIYSPGGERERVIDVPEGNVKRLIAAKMPRFYSGIWVGEDGVMYITDGPGGRILILDPSGTVSSILDNRIPGLEDLAYPADVAVDSDGTIAIAEAKRVKILKGRPGGTWDVIFGFEGWRGRGFEEKEGG